MVETWRMRMTCWIPKATDAHSKYDFPLQQWLYERASMLCYTTLPVLLFIGLSYLQGTARRIISF
jgi:hypothetical protein